MDSHGPSKTVLEQFAAFSSHQWINWIGALIHGRKTIPELYLGDVELDTKLVWIRNKFNAAGIPTEELAKGVVAQIISLSDVKNEKVRPYLFHLIQFAGLLKPEEHAVELELLFKSDTLEDVNFETIPLQAALLNALINFVNIDDLTGYFESRMVQVNDFQTNMLGLKYYYKKKLLKEYFAFVWRLMERAEQSKEYKETAIGIVNSFNEMTYYKRDFNELYDWLIEKKKDLTEMPKVYNGMLAEFKKWLNDDNETIREYTAARLLKGHIDALYHPTEVNLGKFMRDLFDPKTMTQAELLPKAVNVVAEYSSKPDLDPYSAFVGAIAHHGKKTSRSQMSNDHYKFSLLVSAASKQAGQDIKLSPEEHDEFRNFMCERNIQ